ncbi:hypothetical protein RclHR1_12130006 [Rhizophagus clarus]|nr:hypothetical protein RclHR1_12130002 [Rhizophagus clarus]GBB85649.1 hypothetical protein RclHR1_12130006 [Rhizophagus clarus]
MVKIILDNIYNKTISRPINLRPRYDMEHVFKYRSQTDNYKYEKIVEIEKQYDYLSIIRPHETPHLYHVYCLFASFGQVKSIIHYINGELYGTPFDYRKPSVHKSQMAICFKCWKLVKITEVEPRNEYYSGWERWAYEIEFEDLMKIIGIIHVLAKGAIME